MADIELVIKIDENAYRRIQALVMDDYFKHDIYRYSMRRIADGIPFQEICDRENSEIKDEVKDLSKRVENIENQMKEDKEKQLRKLKAELDYAKFRCDLPTIWQMMGK